MTAPLSDYAHAVPLNALTALGLGPLGVAGSDPRGRLRSLQRSRAGTLTALDTAGSTGRRILSVLAALGGAASASEFAFQTKPADSDLVTGSLHRLERAGLVERRADGSVSLPTELNPMLASAAVSMADQNAVSSDQLAFICRVLHLKAPNRKQDRIDAIAAVFADPRSCQRIRSELSAPANALLAKIVRAAGPATTSPESVGLSRNVLMGAAPARFAFQRGPTGPEASVLHELTSRGIVGIADWQAELWIWREAWPLAGEPFYTSWPHVATPPTAPSVRTPLRVPAIVATLDQLLRLWRSSPPAVLKNGEPRLGKTDVRATAKAIRTGQEVVELAGRLAIGIGLVLANTVAETGRGRNRQIERAWMADPSLVMAWDALSPMARWARLLAEWCRPAEPCGEQLLANRHLVLWELAQLDEGIGYSDDRSFADWFADQHASLAVAEAAIDCLTDLRALGVIASTGPAALTAVGAAALDDATALQQLAVSDVTTVTAQADLTIVAPPGLRHDLASRLATLAEIESDAGATVYRLDPGRIARAVQGGEQADAIIAFLAELSSVPLTDTVVRLVRDAAAKAGQVRVIAAPTVVVVSDPADLTTACAVKAAKLVRVTDTVAVSELPHAKVRVALERKGLAPESVLGGSDRRPRSSVEEAEETARRAAAYRSAASRHSSWSGLEHQARQLESKASALANVDARLQVTGPLALTPAVVARLSST